MKLLATDFDGTLFVNGIISKEDINAILKWKENGNAFGIVTGRDLNSIQRRLIEYNIPYDFLICTTGSRIYDKNLNNIYSKKINKSFINTIAKDYINNGLIMVFSTELNTYYYTEGYEDAYLRKDLKNNDKIILMKDLKEIEKINKSYNINQISVKFNSSEEAYTCVGKIEKELKNYVCAYQNVDSVDITPVGISKCIGVQFVYKKMEVRKEEVIAIGDSYNDLSMLEYFDGYTIASAADDIKNKIVNVYKNIEELINFKL